tara:strand:+ start:130 stop:390 length:261 start_codon:yes stop_codon:yes gene_type:complete
MKLKINDTLKSKEIFKYKKMKHDESVLVCVHCTYEERELWLNETISKLKDTDKVWNKKEKVFKTIKSVRVVRGLLDDVIGVETQWQ